MPREITCYFLFSPASPPAMDLRTIMEIEENMQKCGTMPKTNSRLVKKKKTAKIQQNL